MTVAPNGNALDLHDYGEESIFVTLWYAPVGRIHMNTNELTPQNNPIPDASSQHAT